MNTNPCLNLAPRILCKRPFNCWKAPRLLHALVMILALLLALPAQAKVYKFVDNDLVTFDPDSGATTVIGDTGLTIVSGIWCLDFSPDGKLYGIHNRTHTLYEFNIITGEATSVIQIPILLGNAMAISPDGVFYGLVGWPNKLVTFNPFNPLDPGVLPVGIGPIGPNVGGMDFSPDGTLYAITASANELLTIDLATGVGTTVGPLGLSIGANDLSFTCEPDGASLLASANVTTVNPATGTAYGPSLLEINPATGSATIILNPLPGSPTAMACSCDNPAPIITSQPVSTTVCDGYPAQFVVTASGSEPLSYKWRKDGVDIPGANASTLDFDAVTSADAGSYTAVVSNPWGTDTSLPATLSVVPVVAWTDWISGAPQAGTASGQITTPTSTVSVEYSNSRGYAFIQTGTGTDYFLNGDTSLRDPATSPYTSDEVANIPTAAEMIALQYSGVQTLTFSEEVANPVFAYVSLNGNGYGFDQDFEILSFGNSSDGNSPGYWGSGTSYKEVVDLGGGNLEYRLLGTGEPHGVIRFLGSFSSVSWRSLSDEGWNGFTVGVYGTAREVFGEPASIVSQPVGVTVCEGAQMSLTVVANGTEPITYQWKKDGIAIPGEMNSTLVIDSVTPADAAEYNVVVTNDLGGEQSDLAVVVVVPAGPQILQHPQSVTACPGTDIQFEVVAHDHIGGTLSYQWRKGGLPLAGETGSTLVLLNVTEDDSAQYDCVVTEAGCGSTTSLTALLSVVDDPPVITLNGSGHVVLEACIDTYTEPGATALDDCDGIVAVSIGGQAVDVDTPGVYTVLYLAVDSSGQAATPAARVVTVQDTLPPTFDNPPADLVLECGDNEAAIAAWLAAVTASDACGPASVISDLQWGGDCTSSVGTATWTATDPNGLTSIAEAMVVILPDGMLTGVSFVEGGIDKTLPANDVRILTVGLLNSSSCPSEIASAAVVSSSVSPAFQITGLTFPVTLCPGQTLPLALAVDTVGALEGTYHATLGITGRDGASLAVPVTLQVSGRLLPDLSANYSGGGIKVLPDGGPGIPAAGEGLMLSAPIRNMGTADAGPFKVNFFEGAYPLGSVEIAGLATAQETTASLPLPDGLPVGFYLLRVEVDPPDGGELRLTNNAASTVVQVGTTSTGGASILVTAGLTPNCGLTSATLNLHAEYEILSTTTVTGPEGTTTEITRLTYPVQGGLLMAHIVDTSIGIDSAHTDVDGNFTTTLALPEAGSYELVVQVTDATLTPVEFFDVMVPEVDPCQPGGGHEQPGTPDPKSPSESVDLFVCSSDINFADAAGQPLSLPAGPGQPIQVCATVHYFTSAGAPLENQPVHFVARRQFEGEIEVRQLGSALANFAGGGETEVCVPWQVPTEGTWTILVRLDPTPYQWAGNDEATRALTTSVSPPPDTTLQVTATGGGCRALYQWLTGRALYVSPGTGPLPVECAEVTVTAYDENGVFISSRDGIHTNLAGVISTNPYLGLPLGVNRMVVEVTDGTLTGRAEFTIECTGYSNEPGPDTPAAATGDLYVYSEHIAFLREDRLGGLSRNPLPNEPIAIAAELRYWNEGASTPLVGVPVDVNVLTPINGSLVSVPVAQTTVDFPDGGGSTVLCVPWTPQVMGPQIVQVVIRPRGADFPFEEYEGNNAATRLIFVGETDCLLTATAIDDEVLQGESGTYRVTGEKLGSRTPVLGMFLIDQTGSLPEGVTFDYSVAPLTLPGDTMLTIHTTDATPPGRYRFTVVGAGDGCVAMDQVKLLVFGDVTPPEIILTGDDSLTLECGEEFADPGWTANDDTDGDLLDLVEVSGTVDIHVPGTYTLTYTVADAAGNVATVVRTVTVVDTSPPVVTITAPESGYLSPVSAPIDFAGTLEDCSAIVSADWFFTSAGISEGPLAGTVTDGEVRDTYAFTEPGVYSIRLEAVDAEDNAGAADTVLGQFPAYVVIYDPDGGFVTGGGWVWSPPGSLYPGQPAYGQVEGKASFGFVSKYKKGATTPTGQTQFQFKAGDLNFHSNTYDWLVVAGARAQFKGYGIVNGEEGFGFLLTGVDGDVAGGGGVDRFRIKIWDLINDEIVYDNQAGTDDSESLNNQTVIRGGNIVIHK